MSRKTASASGSFRANAASGSLIVRSPLKRVSASWLAALARQRGRRIRDAAVRGGRQHLAQQILHLGTLRNIELRNRLAGRRERQALHLPVLVESLEALRHFDFGGRNAGEAGGLQARAHALGGSFRD